MLKGNGHVVNEVVRVYSGYCLRGILLKCQCKVVHCNMLVGSKKQERGDKVGEDRENGL